MAKGRKLAAELHREVVNRAYAKRMAAPVAPSRSAAPPSVNYVQEVRPDDPPPSCHRCGAVMVPTRFNCRSCGATTEPTEAAPPSEREALKLVLYVLNSAPKQGWDKWRNAVDIVEGWQARAAVPQDRASIERQAAYYFSEIRKFSPLNLDHYSLENWKDFIVWRGAAAAPAPGTVGSATPIGQEEAMKSSLRKIVGKQRRVLGETVINGETVEIAVFDEVLECGHVQAVRQDMYGETLAAKRRCKECVAGATAPPKEG